MSTQVVEDRLKALEAERDLIGVRIEELQFVLKNSNNSRPSRTSDKPKRTRVVRKRSPKMPRAERVNMVRRAIAQSPNGLTSREIVDQLDWPTGTVRNVLVEMEQKNMLTRSGEQNRPTYSLRLS